MFAHILLEILVSQPFEQMWSWRDNVIIHVRSWSHSDGRCNMLVNISHSLNFNRFIENYFCTEFQHFNIKIDIWTGMQFNSMLRTSSPNSIDNIHTIPKISHLFWNNLHWSIFIWLVQISTLRSSQLLIVIWEGGWLNTADQIGLCERRNNPRLTRSYFPKRWAWHVSA